ncbi:class I SAM-dependent rRNA methyltransferase [Parachitinimonas caeni]|uniref:Class I SAM-dependent rRNA methyltransferase n=1 Tax=Parachitinimonas caeni TaxID=3031301 RepID=A0ABT7DU65_9NEIS|nr:class I SAM-dependent rRNA methyltransferase [Parachitinimonas caeni]MDK2123613.1 class I SAM-dependent rRNA methyltransferase [Parachitinimonas caeni]
MTVRLVVKAGREKSLLARHPWLFSGGIAKVEGEPFPGATVRIVAQDGRFLGWGAYSPESQIRVRVWSFDENDRIDADFFRRRLQAALSARASLAQAGNAARLIHAESDGLPGLVVDRYGDVLVVQMLASGVEAWRGTLIPLLQELTGAAAIYERSDADVRALEGLEQRTGLLAGSLPGSVEIIEHGLRYRVDVAEGQKTGFYLDQRDNRRRVGELAAGRDVLNCFCYSGGFSLAALRGGAKSVLSIDSSAEALDTARANLELNQLPADRAEWLEADVFQHLRKLRDAGRSFDLIVLDPPKFAPTAQHVERAARAYKDINLYGFKLLRPGGYLATFTCSGGMSADLFQKIVAGAALDAHADASIVGRFTADIDHPIALNFPESDYLKGLLVRKAG